MEDTYKIIFRKENGCNYFNSLTEKEITNMFLCELFQLIKLCEQYKESLYIQMEIKIAEKNELITIYKLKENTEEIFFYNTKYRENSKEDSLKGLISLHISKLIEDVEKRQRTNYEKQ